ncbi:hypothetical protein GCM10010112_90030 [Actinoplanes lobatus]|uniref:PepSY domain-containing protein n=1 Tax=Actinoplanes lobatus TaxID=113568 RepID=A0A7W7HG24_9ACTN|nr:PepSY domain-containing protein [Actinoplanes lobatus]MBB4749890.1 hypothetical protein [Actinoplanes lobatus]GGN97572.1 hypothetical protein GCM10010112_90030 [Actinoplanes lobatus]GIE44982.1 hypothetical protein Alo02nite_78800 [Actinoplanes lobatus]
MKKKITVAMFAAGSLVVLGFGGAALAEGSDDGRPRAVASPSATASESVDPSESPSPSGTVNSTVPAGVGVTAGEARAIALRAVPGGVIESVERETEHGRIVWDIDVVVGGVEHDIDVDAATGEITRHRTDDDRDGKSRTDDGGRVRSDDSGRDDRADDSGRSRSDDSGRDDRADDSGRSRSDDSGRDGRNDDKGRDDAGDDHGGDRNGSDDD